ncbi:HERC1, partial [Symbiodinium sp. KB8]
VLARFRGGHYAFVPFLAHTPDGVLYYKHTVGSSGAARGRRRVGDQYWGFRCTVRAVNNIAWAGVGQQASSPSFLWGCWVLEMLAEVALPRSQLDRGAVHNGDIVNILLNYLATPRAPHKPHVIGLLTRLFSVPMHFDLQRRPPMERVTAHLGSVVGEVTKKASSMAAAFLPLPALQANELVSTGIGAAFMLDDKWSAFTPIASLTPTPLLQAGLTTSDRATLSGGVTSLAGDDAEWFPPMGVYALEGLPGLTAMAYAREVLKSLATASRIPDLWVLRAAELAHDGGAARGGGRRVQGRPNLQLTTNSLVSIQRAMVLISGGHIANVHGLSLQPTASGRLPHCLAHIGTPAGTCLSPSHPQFASLIGEVDVELVEWMRMRASKTEIRLRELEVWNLQLAPGDERTYPALTLLDTATLRLRAALLIILNTLVNRCLKLVDTSGSAGPWSTGALLRTVSHLIFAETKGELLNAAINRTSTYEDSGVAITLDNELATASKEEGRADVMNSTCIFAQMFRELRHHRAARLRSSLDSKDRMFKVALAGEPGIDWGGIYRDCITRAVNDLFAAPQSNINLFTVVGSAAEADDDVWVPNLALLMRPPSEVPEAAEHTGAEEDATPIVRALAMWRFVGILMGLSWRTRAWLDFTLAPLVWKSLCGEELDLSDLCHVDPALHASLGRMAAMLRGVEGQPDASAEAVPGWDTHFAAQMFVYRSPWRRGGASGGERVGEELL